MRNLSGAEMAAILEKAFPKNAKNLPPVQTPFRGRHQPER